MFVNVHRENGTCGRYENKRDKSYDVELLLTMFTRKDALAATIRKRTT